MSNDAQDLVNTAVSAVRQGPPEDAPELLAALAKLDKQTVLPELLTQVKEASAGVDMKRLRSTGLVDAAFARKVVDAVRRGSHWRLRRAVKGGYVDLVVSLVAVVAALKDAADNQAQESADTPVHRW